VLLCQSGINILRVPSFLTYCSDWKDWKFSSTLRSI